MRYTPSSVAARNVKIRAASSPSQIKSKRSAYSPKIFAASYSFNMFSSFLHLHLLDWWYRNGKRCQDALCFTPGFPSRRRLDKALIALCLQEHSCNPVIRREEGLA